MFQSVQITPSCVEGSLVPPPSKSHTQRAIVLGSMGWGVSTVHHYLDAPDIHAMVAACQHLGAHIDVSPSTLTIQGIGGGVTAVEDVIDVGNSGIMLRFLTAIAALAPLPVVITGDHSIRHNRPMAPLLQALRQLGVSAVSTRGDDYAPVIVHGPMRGGHATLDGGDSQPVSALLLAGLFAGAPLELTVLNPGETPWVEMTLWWMRKLGARVSHDGYRYYSVMPIHPYHGFEQTIPADMSSAAFPVAAALVTGGSVTLQRVEWDGCQGDRQLFDIFREMGARVAHSPETGILTAAGGNGLRGVDVDLNDCIDAVPILAAVACFAETPTRIRNVANAKNKESDRIAVISRELGKMGAHVVPLDDGLTIHPQRLSGGYVAAHNDHRIAMSLAVAALGAKGPSYLDGYPCVAKSYPHFLTAFRSLGANIEGIA